MRLEICFFILSTCLIGISIAAFQKPQQQQQQLIVQKPSGFSVRSYNEDDEISDEYDGQAQTPIGYRSRNYDYSNEDEQQQQQQQQQQEQQQPRQNYQQQRKPQQHQQSFKKDKHLKEIEEELEEEEPDRLALLLEKSQFNCNGKTTGYYADDSINCEVFHYCQESSKHSWVCPEGFTFHQVHLICMPPSGENICEQSSKYHVVNEYLYKPINLQEHQTKPNVTLKYSDRYFPESFYENERYEADDRISHNRQPVQVGFNSQQQQRKSPTQAPITAAPLPYRFSSPTPVQHQQQQQQQQHQHVYRSPEEINISLQQRRPQYFVASTTTPRYVEDDYGYEK